MAWFRAGGGGIPSSLKAEMNDVFNKKFGTILQDYPPEEWPETVNLMGPLPERTVSGAVVAFSDGADDVPLKSCAVTIAPNLDGVSAVTEKQTDGNLLLPNDSDASPVTTNGITRTYSLSGQSFSFNGTNEKTDSAWLIFNGSNFALDGIKKGATYSFYHNLGDGMYAQVTYYNTQGTTRALVNVAGSAGKNNRTTFTVPADFDRLRNFQIGVYAYATTINETDIVFMLTAGSTATAYKPYTTPTTHTANLGRTIYGGSVDVVNGTGKTKVYKHTYTGDNVTTVSLTYGQADEGYTHLYFYTSGLPLAYSPSSSTVLSDIGVSYNATAMGAGSPPSSECFAMTNTGTSPNQRPTLYWYTNQTWESVSAFKTWLNEHPITIVYEVTDEEDFTFTPVPILSRLGDNTLWSDDGDIEVTYRRDIDLALAQ